MSADLPRRVLASMRCGVVTVDRFGVITSINVPAAAHLGVDPSTSVGRDCREVFGHCSSMAHLLLDAQERGTLPDRAELELEIEGTRRVLIGFSLSRIEGDDGEPVGSAIFFKDLTVVEEQREREALRNRLASLGEMAAQLTHEIRNRLGGIQAFLGLVRRRLLDDPEGEAYLERAAAEIQAANHKMEEILDFVRPIKLDLEPADVAELCREAIGATLARFPGAEVRVEWKAVEPLPRVIVDAPKVRDALTNLVANAIEAAATDRVGTLRVRIAAEHAPVLVAAPLGGGVPGLRGYGEGRGSRVRIEIADNGPGIPPDVLQRIFHPFFTTKDRGSGLGVSTAQKILDAHSGSLDVESSPGRGATFIVRLPAEIKEEEGGG